MQKYVSRVAGTELHSYMYIQDFDKRATHSTDKIIDMHVTSFIVNWVSGFLTDVCVTASSHTTELLFL